MNRKKRVKTPEFLLTINSLASTNKIVKDYTLLQQFCSNFSEKNKLLPCSLIKNNVVYGAGHVDDSFGNLSGVKRL